MRWGRFILVSLFLLTKGSHGKDGSESKDETFEITMNMPQADSATLRVRRKLEEVWSTATTHISTYFFLQHNDYRCTSVALPSTDSYIGKLMLHPEGESEILMTIQPVAAFTWLYENKTMKVSNMTLSVHLYFVSLASLSPVRFEPRADPLVAHHMLLYGCVQPGSTAMSWY